MNNQRNEITSLPMTTYCPEVKPTVRSSVVKALKRVRASQPFNYLATSVVHACQQVTGVQSEFVIKHLHRVGSVRRRLPNGRRVLLWSQGDDWVSTQVYWRGWNGYEPETVPLFFRLSTQAQVTLDVGAYVGFFSLLAAHANPKGKVYAFEPLPSVYRRLRRNVELNQLANVQCIPAAIGEIEGEADFWHIDAETPTSSSLSREFMGGGENLVCTKVAVITLDRFAQTNHLNRVDLMKLDTESTEYQVLRGMVETIQRDHPIIISEVLPGRGGEAPLEEILRRYGYRFYHLTPAGPKRRDKVEGHPEWLNYLFTPLSSDEVDRL
ncbi:MAG: FkbM family methyltransferase [Acidobacteria bacterium]|nr:FkbM family methyltransferase [Acidobacteriota bacterium]